MGKQVRAAMGLVRKLPGIRGPPGPPPVLSVDEQVGEERNGRRGVANGKERGAERCGQKRGKGRRVKPVEWKVSAQSAAGRLSQHSHNHLAIIRGRETET